MKELEKYLTINSIFSAISGSTMLLLSNTLNDLFNIHNMYVFPVIGLNLIVFAAFVWYVSKKQLCNKVLVMTITVLDAFWVIGSAVIVLTSLFDLSTNGYILISTVALWIAFLAYKQLINIRYI
jgi:hypothetical protein